MAVAAAVAFLLILAGAFEGYLLAQKKRWGELIAAAFLWLFAAAYAFIITSPMEVKTPSRLIIDLVNALYRRFF